MTKKKSLEIWQDFVLGFLLGLLLGLLLLWLDINLALIVWLSLGLVIWLCLGLWVRLILGLALGLVAVLMLSLTKWFGMILVITLVLVLITAIIISLQSSLKKRPSKSILKPKPKTKLPKWIHGFLSDEEKAAILIDYRIKWYENKRPNKWIRFKVWLKTLHYLFYEVWFKERLDKIKSFQVGMPRW